jgi:hypothetical protein
MRSERGVDMNGKGRRRPLVVEIMGPAAAGKTSLVRALCATDDRIRAGLAIGPVRFSTAFVRKVVPLVPVWAIDHRNDRWFNRREMKSIAFLEAWHRELEERRPYGVAATIFDHGPVFRLARLREFGPEIARSDTFERWWVASRDRWMDTLDLLVWLDAPDEVLLQRVGERGHGYLDAASGEDKHEFLARYRRIFAEIVDRGSMDRPRLLRIRSDQRPVGKIAEDVLAAFAAVELPGAVPQERSR